MTSFLRDLSPARAHDATRAVPLLPSPFETMQPLRAARLGPRAEVDTPIQPRLLGSPLIGDATERSARPERQSPAPSDGDAPSAKAHATGTLGADAPLSPVAATDRTIREPRVERRDFSQSRDTGATVSTPSHVDTNSGRAIGSTARALPASTIESPPTFTIASTIRSTARAAVSPTAAAPLSARALAAKPALAVEPRPVVHVTIDRVEVHAPAAPVTPKPSARPRTTHPDVSLEDYLRGHDNRRGGVS